MAKETQLGRSTSNTRGMVTLGQGALVAGAGVGAGVAELGRAWAVFSRRRKAQELKRDWVFSSPSETSDSTASAASLTWKGSSLRSVLL